MKNRNSYKGKHLDFVLKLLDDKRVSITEACQIMCKKFDIEYHENVRKGISRLVNDQGKGNKKKIEDTRDFKKAKKRKFDKKKKTFIITYAQNATPVHKGLWKNIEAYAESLGANLHVIAGRYKNPTSMWSGNQDSNEWWDSKVTKYLDANRHNIHKHLQVLSDVKVSPTASNPLSGLNGMTGLESCVVGHPRQHLKSLPVLEGYPNKLLLSTGACTKANYTDSKSGKKGEFHHMYGFVIVELDGKNFHIRQVNADNNGDFYDLFNRVKDGDVMENKDGCEAAVLGDIHIQHNDNIATDISFGLLDIMKPKHTMIHDIIDCESISHWDTLNPFRMMKKEEEGTDNLYQEIRDMIQWSKDRLKYNLVVVRSNHDDFLDRWLQRSDWRRCGNRKLYLEAANILANECVAQKKGVIPYYLESEFGDKIKTLGLDDSYRVLGWELGMHGHIGANGSRGGANQFKAMNTKTITGHTHQPTKIDGHMSVGTLTHLRVGYNKGLSSWMQTNVLIYPDGKAQHIHIVNNKYCRDMPK